MANVFSITAASNTVPLDARGQGEIAFTVSNTSGRHLRGRAKVVAKDPAQKGWLTVAGEPEQDFAAGGSGQVRVRVAVPPGSPAGTFAFRLDTLSVQNPDEDYTQGPWVTFKAAGQEKPKAFPWWLVAVAALLVLGGVGLWLILRSKSAPTTPSSQTPSNSTKPVILGVGVDNGLYTKLSLRSPWVPVPNSRAVIGVMELNDGTFVGVGTDNLLYTRDTLTSTWQQVPGSGAVIRVLQTSDGTIVGVGTDHNLYTRSSVTTGPWQFVPGSGLVYDVAQLKDGTFLGIGMSHDLWTRATLAGSPWVNIPASGSVIGIAIQSDGTILGVGTDYQLYTRATVISSWTLVRGSGTVIAAISMK